MVNKVLTSKKDQIGAKRRQGNGNNLYFPKRKPADVYVSLRCPRNGVYARLPLLDDLTAQTLVVGPQRITALPMKCALK